MRDFIAALGLVFFIEGVTFAAFPRATRKALAAMMEATDGNLRTAGIVAAIAGVLLVWFVRG